MEYKQHFLYQLGFSLLFSLFWFVTFAFSKPLLVLIPLSFAFLAYLRWKKYRVILDEHNIVLEYGVFSSHREQVRIDKIQKIKVSRSLVQSLFSNLGTIQLETGNDLTITLENIEFYRELHSELEKRTNKK